MQRKRHCEETKPTRQSRMLDCLACLREAGVSLRRRQVALLLAMMVLMFAFPSTARAGSGDTTTGLVGWWKLDETSGTTAGDSSASGINGTMENGLGGTDAVDGRVGGALEFDGSDDVIDIGTSTTYNFTGAFSISAWIKPNDMGSDFYGADSGTIAVRSDGDTEGYWFHIGDNAGSSYLSIWSEGNDDDLSSPPGVITAGVWQLVTVVHTAANVVTLYVNNKEVATGSLFFTGAAGESLQLGTWLGVGTFDGALDDIRIYNRALSADDITALYVRSDKFCESPADAPGVIRYNEDRSALEYCDGKNWIMMGLGSYTPVAVTFDGTNDWLDKNANFTGTSDGKKLAGSLWFRRGGGLGTSQQIFRASSGKVQIEFLTTDNIRISAEDSANTNVFEYDTSAITDSSWHHLLFSVDVAGADPSKSHVYIDGASDLTVVTAVSDLSIKFTAASFQLGSGTAGANKFNGDIADFWLDFGTYIDFSSAAMRAKFRSPNGMPMYLGADGSLPTGVAPDIFLSGDVSGWHTNKGAGGGFTENGALTYASAQMYPSVGLVGHWPLNETGGTEVADMAGDSIGFASGGLVFDPSGGKLGGAAVFDGIDDQILMPSGDFKYSSSISFGGWFRPDADKEASDVLGWDNGSADAYELHIDTAGGEAFSCDVYDTAAGPGFVTAKWITTITNGTWYHVMCVADFDAGSLNLYVDGVLRASVAAGGPIFYSVWGTQRLIIGSNFDNVVNEAPFVGRVDDVRLYDRALTADEVKALYTNVSCSNPVGQPGEVIYNTDHKVMQYCNGVDWVAMSKVDGTGGGGCVSPAGQPGELRYISADEVMQYCNSEDWVDIGKPAPPTNGLIGYWRLDETTGTTVTDSTGNGTDGTMLGGLDASTDSVPAVLGGGLEFASASSQYISLPFDADTQLSDTQGTIAAWIKSATDHVGQNLTWPIYWQRAHSNIANKEGVILELHQGFPGDPIYPSSRFGGSSFEDYTTPIAADTWYHIVLTWDAAGNAFLYLNGALIKSGSKPGAIVNYDSPPRYIGRNTAPASSYEYAAGVIDDIRLYNRALSPDEVKQLYEATR